MLKYETLLDLSRQRLEDIAASPNKTRDARHTALKLLSDVEAELAAFNRGRPLRHLSEPFVTDTCHPDHLAFSAATRAVLEEAPRKAA